MYLAQSSSPIIDIENKASSPMMKIVGPPPIYIGLGIIALASIVYIASRKNKNYISRF